MLFAPPGLTFRALSRPLLLASSALGLGFSAPALAQPGPAPAASAGISFDIPAQPLEAAMRQYMQQSGIQVGYESSEVGGRTSAAVQGRFGPTEALSRLLSGTGLTYRFTAPTAVRLEPAPAADTGTVQLGAVRVEGSASPSTDSAGGYVQEPATGITGYVATRSSGATKTDTPLIRTPASISVVSHDQIVDQGALSISQALRYTPGVVAEQRGINEDSLEYLYTRGFQATTFLDGLAIPFAGFNIATRDSYLIDRVESVRGPVSVLYGQTPPGGLVNIVTKLPTATPIHEVFFQSGSYGRVQGGIDLGGPIGGSDFAYRFVATGLTTGTQTDYVRQKRIAVAPSITWRPDDATSLTLMANYQRDPEAGAFNYVPAVGTVLPGVVHIPRSFNSGDPGFDRFTKEEESVGYRFEHRFDSVLRFRQNFRYLHNSQTIDHVGDGSGYDATGTALVRSAYYNYGKVDAVTVDNQLVADFNTGPFTHELVGGVDFQNTQYNHHFAEGRFDDANPPNLSITNPVYDQPVPEPDFLLGSSNRQRTRQTGLYLQDQISLDRLTIVGGLRQDWTNTHTVSYVNGSITDQDAHALTGRIGITYAINDQIAPYFSYSTSFQPQGGATDKGVPLKPTRGEQYEAGVKYQPTGSKSFFTAAVFDLRQTNVTVSNSLYPGSVTQTGEVRSRGVELEAHTYLTDRVQLIASYTYDDVKNVKATATILDKAPAGIPRNMASLWLSYDLPDSLIPGLKAGAGVRFVDSSFGDTINSFRAPSYTLADLGLQYDIGRAIRTLDGLQLTANVSNLFDKTYAVCTGITYCTYGQGRQVLAGLKYRW